jgi:hypothetical protein
VFCGIKRRRREWEDKIKVRESIIDERKKEKERENKRKREKEHTRIV